MPINVTAWLMDSSVGKQHVSGKRPVGRPSRALERREQILAAVERCIVEHGLERTTLARVADEAAVPRSLIHHYLGNREALLRATASRATTNVERALREALTNEDLGSGVGDIDHALDVMFGPRSQDPAITHLIDELGVAALRNDVVRALMAEMYNSFVTSLEGELRRAFPHAPLAKQRTVAHAIVGLVDAASRFADYGFDAENFPRMRTVASQLIDSLREEAK